MGILSLSTWAQGLALSFPHEAGWLVVKEEVLMFDSASELLERPEDWSGLLPPEQRFVRGKVQAVMLSTPAPEGSEQSALLFLQRSSSWSEAELRGLRDSLRILTLQLAYEEARGQLEEAVQQSLAENKLLGLGHLAQRLGLHMKQLLEGPPDPDAWNALSGLVEQLLGHARRPAGGERVLLHKLLEEAVRLAQPRLTEVGALVAVENPLPVTILGRVHELRKLLLDLILLCLQAQPEGAPFVEIDLRMDAAQAHCSFTAPPLDLGDAWTVCQEIALQHQGTLIQGEGHWRLSFPLAADAHSETLPIDVLPQAPARRLPYLCVVRGPLAGTVFPLEVSELQLGRGESCDISLPYQGVSRVHARVQVVPPGKVRILDAQSRNGTFVNGQRVDERGLIEGDTVCLGSECELVLGYR